MLVILYGLPCTGKSTIIGNLVSNYHFKYINCYVTRNLRQNDKARIKVSVETFKKMQVNGDFFAANEHYDSHYGALYSDILAAIDDKQNFYIVDYLIQNRKDLEPYNHHKILIVPDSIESLTKWVIGSTRLERLYRIQHEYKLYYTEEMISQYRKEGFKIIINGYGVLDDTIKQILDLLEVKHSEDSE